MTDLPIWLVFVLAVAAVVGAVEAGFRLGRAVHRKTESEKESPVSAIANTTLGLLAFILAFTFAIVTERFDHRKGLVREEAGLLRTAFARSEFLEQPDRDTARQLLRRYVDVRLEAAAASDLREIPGRLAESAQLERQLWDMAVRHARVDMNSDVAALYIESLNDLAAIHAQRVAVGLQMRIPSVIWWVLLTLMLLAMTSVGYQTSIAGSRRTWLILILAVSFSLVITLIAELDRPDSQLLRVPHQPLTDVRAWMDTRSAGD